VLRIFAEPFGIHGVPKVWRQMNREGCALARCTIDRLMTDLSLQGVIHSRLAHTMISGKSTPCFRDQVNRQLYAPAPYMF
jgi:putative transposase